jgi:hypothetical protein
VVACWYRWCGGGIGLELRGFNLYVGQTLSSSRSNAHNRWRELQCVCFRMFSLGVSHLTALAKQLLWRQSMASNPRTDKIYARRDLGYYAGFVFILLCPPPSSASERVQPTKQLGLAGLIRPINHHNGFNSPYV